MVAGGGTGGWEGGGPARSAVMNSLQKCAAVGAGGGVTVQRRPARPPAHPTCLTPPPPVPLSFPLPSAHILKC